MKRAKTETYESKTGYVSWNVQNLQSTKTKGVMLHERANNEKHENKKDVAGF